MTKIYGIRDKFSHTFHEFNGKSCWKTAGAAKLSYYANERKWDRDAHQWVCVKFDDQATFEVVELTEIVAMYEGLCK